MTTTAKRSLLAAVATIVSFVAVWGGGGYIVYVANLILVDVVLALGLNIAIGDCGQFALAQGAFYGVGIYVSAGVQSATAASFPFALIVAAAATGLLGAALGLLVLRARDVYLALVTFAFGESIQWILNNWTSVTGGPNGLSIPSTAIFSYHLSSDRQAYPIICLVALGMVGISVLVSRGRLGRAMRAVKDSDIAAQSLGISAARTKVVAFGLCGAYAGVAGAMFASFSTFIQPSAVGFGVTVEILTMIVVGGLGSVGGAVAGAAVLGIIAQALEAFPPAREFLYGALLLLFMVFRPEGLLPRRGVRWIPSNAMAVRLGRRPEVHDALD